MSKASRIVGLTALAPSEDISPKGIHLSRNYLRNKRSSVGALYGDFGVSDQAFSEQTDQGKLTGPCVPVSGLL